MQTGHALVAHVPGLLLPFRQQLARIAAEPLTKLRLPAWRLLTSAEAVAADGPADEGEGSVLEASDSSTELPEAMQAHYRAVAALVPDPQLGPAVAAGLVASAGALGAVAGAAQEALATLSPAQRSIISQAAAAALAEPRTCAPALRALAFLLGKVSGHSRQDYFADSAADPAALVNAVRPSLRSADIALLGAAVPAWVGLLNFPAAQRYLPADVQGRCSSTACSSSTTSSPRSGTKLRSC